MYGAYTLNKRYLSNQTVLLVWCLLGGGRLNARPQFPLIVQRLTRLSTASRSDRQSAVHRVTERERAPVCCEKHFSIRWPALSSDRTWSCRWSPQYSPIRVDVSFRSDLLQICLQVGRECNSGVAQILFCCVTARPLGATAYPVFLSTRFADVTRRPSH